MGIYDVVDAETKAGFLGRKLSTDHNRHHLEITGCDHPLDVSSFEGHEGLSTCFAYQIQFTSVDDAITPQEVLNCPASFLFQGPQDQEPQRRVYGVITRFQKGKASRDQTEYSVTLRPRLSLLENTTRTAIFQHLSIPQTVEKILRDRHQMAGQDFLLDLQHSYPAHEQDMQYKETDLGFIARKLAWAGIWYRFDMDSRLGIDIPIFADDQSRYVFGDTLPVRPPAGDGMNDGGTLSVWNLAVSHHVVQRGVQVKDYNYRAANAALHSGTDPWQPDHTTYGTPYHYSDRYLERGAAIDPEMETGSFHARLHAERYRNGRTIITGVTNDPSLYPGKVLEFSERPDDPALRDGILIISTRNGGGRSSAYKMEFTAIPYDSQVGFRPRLEKRPHIAGTIPARVSSTEKNDIYAHMDEQGRYRVKFDFDLDQWDKGRESLWVRLAKPYSGDTYGFHYPLLDNTEVAIAFEDGDPDRPYIAHALHDSVNPDHVTIENYRRNVIRTPANNKLRMEDERGKEHVKLSTEHGGKSQLNLGHLVNGQRQKRGEGFELRTDQWGAIRAGQGIFISADERKKATSTQLDMAEATGQLEQALNQARQLKDAADASKVAGTDVSTLQKLVESALRNLQEAAILISAPAGIAQTTASSMVHHAGKDMTLNAGESVSVNAHKNIAHAAADELALFAHNGDLRAVAGYGKIELQAQENVMNLDAKQDISVTSHAEKITCYSPKEIHLSCGESHIQILPDQVILNAPSQILLKSANVLKVGPAPMPIIPQALPQPIRGYDEMFVLTDENNAPMTKFRYKLVTAKGEVIRGVTDEMGRTSRPLSSVDQEGLKIYQDDGKE